MAGSDQVASGSVSSMLTFLEVGQMPPQEAGAGCLGSGAMCHPSVVWQVGTLVCVHIHVVFGQCKF